MAAAAEAAAAAVGLVVRVRMQHISRCLLCKLQQRVRALSAAAAAALV